MSNKIDNIFGPPNNVFVAFDTLMSTAAEQLVKHFVWPFNLPVL